MNISITKPKKHTFFYGWVIVAGLFLLMSIVTSIIGVIHSLFLGPASSGLNVSSTMFSLNFTIIAIAIGVTSPITGKLLGKVNLKYIMSIGGLITGLGFASYGLVNNIYLFYVISLVIGVFYTGVNQLVVSYVINNWFKKKQGLALGISFSGASLGTFVFMPIIASYMGTLGYAKMYMILGIIVALVSIIVSSLIIVEFPKQKGLTPLSENEKVNNDNNEIILNGYTKSEALKSSFFWIFVASIFGLGIISSGVQTHLALSLEKIGHTPTLSANIVATKSIFGLLGSIGVGVLLDKLSIKTVIPIIGIGATASIALLLFSGNVTIAYLFTALNGVFMIIASIGPSYLTTQIFGNKDYGSILGLVFLVFLIGGSLGPTISGLIFDLTGGYALAWIIYSVISALLFLGIMISYALSRKGNKGEI